ncbi:MAG: hypothetical protein B7X37_01400 [Halothiobacillus sp. 14-55-98]|jgi:hypothetical protein|nr:MAG: hypothetical protein B7X37_01400 [Halothiobacillus sp. 14-55-98]
MSHHPYSIELHDSRLSTIRRESAELILLLSPAYIHRDGKGWRQMAELAIAGGMGDFNASELPAHISDGTLKTVKGPYQNLLMLPLRDGGPVVLEVELESGAIIRVQGHAVEVRLFGEPEFIEDVA